MGRRQTDSEAGRFALLILFLMGVISCCIVYSYLSVASVSSPLDLDQQNASSEEAKEEKKYVENLCCRGIEHLELWGEAVKWGSDFKVNSSEQCCLACKEMCDGPCLCDSWVFCGNRQACGSRFGECWLKKQKNSLDPDQRESGDHVMWTSGLIFAKGEDVVGLETEYGILHIKVSSFPTGLNTEEFHLFPDCAPYSVAYILELLQLRHSAGCQFYRAESRGSFWNSEGNHVENAPFGPPFALVQGTLVAHGIKFKEIALEFCPAIERGSVAWVGSGPDFFISLANHVEWKKAYTVFGSVLPRDMEIVEKISQLPTKPEVWSNINVSVLEKPVMLQFQRI
ncbi:hypothetical protein TIFTF001_017478 [Ficus carica]|uniref:PPIase cyclophilin-type domain-containing protein n=1 Tax=Ficus carica TaxID=3494 RepID=A0AA88A995_FICCA|nr:hypothetical protein TIFTF001_017478 [Ficus carica]